MAEQALFGIAKSVLQQLASLALDEFQLLWLHKAQLEQLEDTVTTIQNVLQDADRRQATDFVVQGWLARLRAALYEADDLFDIISAKFLLAKEKKGTKFGKKVRHFLSSVKIAHKVEAIRERLDYIARDIKGFNFFPIQNDLDPPSRIGREQTHSYVPRNEVVGREQETEDVVGMLLPDCSQQQRGVSVISIIGIGGLGKTTLAKLVYNDERVQKGFDLYMWACINNFSHLKHVLITLLKSATTKSETEDLDIDQLQYLFRKEIEGKRFLLVLDDVWDEDPQNWRELRNLLSSGKDGSKVVTTTRSELVAQHLCATKPYFRLQGMSDESAWLLFKKLAFVDEEDCNNSELERIGRQIVRKCANVPLAIVTMASLLREKEKERWFPLVNDELSKVFPDEYKKITHVLAISYKELPYSVKRCFGYCSLFPKDYLFEKSELVRLWIAQGFVEPLVNQSLEDRAEEYLFYLVKRCFFQLTTRDKEMKSIVTYQMHDLMRDLATTVAGSESILFDQTAHSSWDNTVRHVSIYNRSESVVDSVCSFSHSKSLRTFLHPCRISLGKNTLKKLMSGFRSLRVLDLSELGIEEVPKSIGELVHLRFLDLSRNFLMERLPSSICRLRHLQSLILRMCVGLKELPEDLGNLLSLRHLLLQDCYNLVKMPSGLAALTSLVTLDRLIVHNPTGGLKYLEDLDNLSGSLEIELPTTGWENSTMDAERSFLLRKSRLHALDIVHDTDSCLPEPDTTDTAMNSLQPPPNLVDLSIKFFGGKEMPHWILCLHKLTILKLEGCKRCVELPPFGLLPSLKGLYISCMSSMLTIEDIKFYKPDSFFPSLETLSIRNMLNLTSWWLQAPTVLPAFPRVTKVIIQGCPKLTTCMPLFPIVEDLRLLSVREEIIWQAIGSKATSGTSHGSVLKKLEIREIEDLSSIAEAQIRHLSALQYLRIYECKQLETMSWNGLANLISLEFLVMGLCEKFSHEQEVRRIQLPRLRHLEIPTVNRNLLKGLKYMASLETLIIQNSFNQELQEEDDEEEEGLPWKHLQKLHSMELVFGDAFSMRANQRLLHGFQNLTSLKELTLCKCKVLYLSWRALLGLNHLQTVKIEDVEEVIEDVKELIDALMMKIEDVEEVIDVDSDAMMIQTQPISHSIRELTIRGGSGEWVHDIPWKSLPILKTLYLIRIRNLEALPEGIQHLAALECLRISDIKDVVSLPYWMSSLSSLQYFEISSMSEELEKRCKRLKGEDWPKIQHIPNICIW